MNKTIRIITLATALLLCAVSVALAADAAKAPTVPNHIQRKAHDYYSRVYGKGGAPQAQVDAAMLASWLQNADPTARAWACYALGEVGSPAYAPALRAMTADSNPDARRLAAKALGKIGDRQAVALLCALMQDQSQPCQVRCAAACALGMIGDQRAYDALCRACADHSARLSAEAAQAKARLASAPSAI